jgi:hypothetical protein
VKKGVRERREKNSQQKKNSLLGALGTTLESNINQ